MSEQETADELGKELRQIEALFFGGFLEDTPETGIAWRVFDEVIAIKKERDTLKAALDKAMEENLRLRDQAKNPLPPAPKGD